MPPRMQPAGSGGRAVGDKQQVGPDGLLDPSLKPKPMNRIRKRDKQYGKCEHGRQKLYCRECGGKGICHHNRIRRECRDCKGKARCEHNRLRTTCKECHGGAICQHGRRRFNCKDCKREGTGGGGGICMHFKDKYSCKECAAAGIGGPKRCQHGKIAGRCVECGGPGICEHRRVKASCKFCLKVRACIHNKKRNTCLDCKPIRDLGAMGVSIKAHELLSLFGDEKFYFHPRRDELTRAMEELRKFALAHAAVPDPQQSAMMRAVDVVRAAGAEDLAAEQGQLGQGSENRGDAVAGGGAEDGPVAGIAEGPPGAVPRPPGHATETFLQEMSSKSLREIMDGSYRGEGSSKMRPLQPPPPPSQPTLPSAHPHPNDRAQGGSSAQARLQEILLSDEHVKSGHVPPEEYQKMMKAAHHLMAQHVMVMKEMKQHSESSQFEDMVMPCPHGKKSRLSCKSCKEHSAATRKAAKEAEAVSTAAGCVGVGGAAGMGGPDGVPADQGIQQGREEEEQDATRKKGPFHSLEEYTAMLNAAEFLMYEHIKTTKELNTTVGERLREKQQYEELQRQSQEAMLKRMEGEPIPAVELAKLHHRAMLGLKLGPAPGSRKPAPDAAPTDPPALAAPPPPPPQPVTQPQSAVQDGQQSLEGGAAPEIAVQTAAQVLVAKRPDPKFVYKPMRPSDAELRAAEAKAAQERAEKIERAIIKAKEAKAKADSAAEQKKLKAKKRGRADGDEPEGAAKKPADAAAATMAPHTGNGSSFEPPEVVFPQKPRITMPHEQYLTTMRSGVLSKYQQEQYHEVGAIVDVELMQYEKMVDRGLLTVLQEQTFQHQLSNYMQTLQKVALQQQMNLRLPSLSVSQEVFDHLHALGLVKTSQMHEYSIRRRLMKVDREQFAKLKAAGAVSPIQEGMYEEASHQYKQYQIDYQTRLLALLQTPPHMQVEIPFVAISPFQVRGLFAAGLISPLQNEQYAKQYQEQFQYMSILPEQYQAISDANILTEAQKLAYKQQVQHIQRYGRLLVPGEKPPQAQPALPPPPPPPTKRMRKKEDLSHSESLQLNPNAAFATKPASTGGVPQGPPAAGSFAAAAAGANITGNAAMPMAPDLQSGHPFASLAHSGLARSTVSAPPLAPAASYDPQPFGIHPQAAAAGAAAAHPPPMHEAQCRRLVHQHVSWLQQRKEGKAPMENGGNAAPVPGEAGAASGVQVGDGGNVSTTAGVAASGGAAEGAGKEGEPTEAEAAQVEAGLQQLKKFYDEGVLSKAEFEREKELMLESSPLYKAGGGKVKPKALKFDKYHLTLSNTVLAILAPARGSTAVEIAAWDLISGVIDPTHFVAQRWRTRRTQLVDGFGGMGSQPMQRKSKKNCVHGRAWSECAECEHMKMEIVSIIYSITAPYEAAAKSGMRPLANASVPAQPVKKVTRKRKAIDETGKGKEVEAGGAGKDKAGTGGEGSSMLPAKPRHESDDREGEAAGGPAVQEKAGEEAGVAKDDGRDKEDEAAGKPGSAKKARKRRRAIAGNGWKQWLDAQGRKYYHHAERNVTQWTRPPEIDEPEQPRAPGQTVERSAAIPAPHPAHGWQEYSMPDGRKYYYHAASKKSQWNRPLEMDGPRQPVLARPPLHPMVGMPTAGVVAAAHPWQHHSGIAAPFVIPGPTSWPSAAALGNDASTLDLLQTWQHGMQMPAAASAPVATLPGKGAEKATKICEHGRRRNRCKDCGDVVICVHGKTKYSCKECRAARVCVHNKIKSRCNLCICPHFQEQGKVGQCADCKKALRDKEKGNGDVRTDEEGHNMMTDEEGAARGGRGIGGASADIEGGRSAMLQEFAAATSQFAAATSQAAAPLLPPMPSASATPKLGGVPPAGM